MPQLDLTIDSICRPPHAIYRSRSRNDTRMDRFVFPYSGVEDRSEFVRVQLQLDEARDQLSSSAVLAPNWDSYGAESPNAQSREDAGRILRLLQQLVIAPTRLLPSAEGGIGIVFSNAERYADIECLNSGEILLTTYFGMETPLVREIGSTDAELSAAIEKIRVHLAS